MGRLFWKFFFFFFLAQMTSIMGVSLVFWFNSPERTNDRLAMLIEDSPPARTLVDAAAGTLRYGGEDALVKLLRDWQDTPAPQVYAVLNGQEVLSRPIAPSLMDVMDDFIRHGGDDDSGSVRQVSLANGRHFVLFVPASARSQPDHFPPSGGQPPSDRSPPEHAQQGPGVVVGEPGGPPPVMPDRRPGRRMFPMMPMLMGTLASLLFAGLLAWYFSKPIKSLRKAFERVAGGDLKTDAAVAMGQRNDELADLGRGFDQMTAKLEALINGQKRLLHYVSHEIRSPLARLQVAIGLARQSPEKMGAGIERIELEANRMDALLGDVLELSRLESGVLDLRKERFAFGDLLAPLIEDANFEAETKHIKVVLTEDADYEVEVQPDLFYRAIENLVRNAIKYSPEGSTVQIQTVQRAAGRFAILVTDQGTGVPESDIEQVFKPFYRATMDITVAGHGMGLAISRQIIDMHGGTIALHNLHPKGLQVEVVIAYVGRKARIV
jgi:signal transduction histidine kinase